MSAVLDGTKDWANFEEASSRPKLSAVVAAVCCWSISHEAGRDALAEADGDTEADDDTDALSEELGDTLADSDGLSLELGDTDDDSLDEGLDEGDVDALCEGLSLEDGDTLADSDELGLTDGDSLETSPPAAGIPFIVILFNVVVFIMPPLGRLC